ncbi:MAG TPA: sugar phosphate nucleotidyltransferase [Geminicoccaceae bacterium]|nr:sugar phosphate nucleotidyltransferase [Geminicoccaceae bacterium]
MPGPSPPDVPVFILCGGLGTRLGETSQLRPKPMVEIGDRPLLAHIMGLYDRHGFRRFVLCTGHRGDVISTYFLNFTALHSDFTVETRTRSVSYHQTGYVPDWEVTVAHTGMRAMTGARIARAAARHLGDAEHFAVTYGDGLTDADLADELAWHLAHDRLGTVLAVNPPSQFGRLELREDGGAAFEEKAVVRDDWVNGGFFFFRRGFLDYLSTEEDCVLEERPLARLAADGQLGVYRCAGFWACMDTLRDRERMVGLWETGAAPWQG